jgi:hypothetical protein
VSDVVADPDLVARCGLYCGACGAYRKGRCPGCARATNRSWCKVRTCCGERSLASCAECADHADPAGCPKFDNVVARLFGLVMNSDRRAAVLKLRALGRDAFAAYMAGRGWQSIPRRGARRARI